MTSTFAVAMVKDEADVIALTVGNMLRQVDHVYVADNGSTDGTRDILDGLATMNGGRLLVLDDPEVAYYQSEKMSALACKARDNGADWVVPFDADEYWYAVDGRTIAEVLADCRFPVAAAALTDHVATGQDDPDFLPWRRAHQLSMPKVAFQPMAGFTLEQGNHSVLDRRRKRPPVRGGLLAVHHYPYRSAAQFVRKVRNGAAAYAAGGDRIRADFGAHWRSWGAILARDGEKAVRDIFLTWYYREDPTVPIQIGGEWQEALVYDPAPETVAVRQ